jgi:beta-phosphoglucomutase
MIKTVLFDYDGTLLNTDEAHLACWNQILKKYEAALDESFYISHCVGVQTYHIAEQIKKTFPMVSVSAHEFASTKDDCFEQWIATKTISTMPGVPDMLTFLVEMKIEIGIVTGAPLASIQKTLEDNDLTRYFQAIITRESVERGKPAPDGYLIALHKMGAHACEAASFEDTTVGVLSARAAGMKAFAVPSIYTKGHDFSAADVVCKDMFEARTILEKMIFQPGARRAL